MSYWTRYVGPYCQRTCTFCEDMGIRARLPDSIRNPAMDRIGTLPLACNWDSITGNVSLAVEDKYVVVLCHASIETQLQSVPPRSKVWLVWNVVDECGKEITPAVSMSIFKTAYARIKETSEVDCIAIVITLHSLDYLEDIVDFAVTHRAPRLYLVYPFSSRNIYPSVVEAYRHISKAIGLAKRAEIEVITGVPPHNSLIKSDVYPKVIECHESTNLLDVDWSIIVPTYNRLSYLRYTIPALLRQSTSFGSFEVIVVDDGSSDQTEDYFRRWRKDDSTLPLVYLRLDRATAYREGDFSFRTGLARNTGAIHARGKWLLFVDCDILAPSSLLQAHADAQDRRKQCLVMGNRIRLTPEAIDLSKASRESLTDDAMSALPSTLKSSAWLSLDEQPWHTVENYWNLFSSNNFSLKRSDFLEIGMFDPTCLHYGLEDTELGYRLLRAGFEFLYHMHAVGYHIYHPSEGVDEAQVHANHRLFMEVAYRKHLDASIIAANAWALSNEEQDVFRGRKYGR